MPTEKMTTEALPPLQKWKQDSLKDLITKVMENNIIDQEELEDILNTYEKEKSSLIDRTKTQLKELVLTILSNWLNISSESDKIKAKTLLSMAWKNIDLSNLPTSAPKPTPTASQNNRIWF